MYQAFELVYENANYSFSLQPVRDVSTSQDIKADTYDYCKFQLGNAAKRAKPRRVVILEIITI